MDAARLRRALAGPMTMAEAAALHETGWWSGMPTAEAAHLQLLQERLVMPIMLYHQGVTELLGRPVRFHELGEPARLLLEAQARAALDGARQH